MLNPNVPGFGKTKWMFSAGRKEKRREAISHLVNSLSMEMIILMCVFMGEMHISHAENERKRHFKIKE